MSSRTTFTGVIGFLMLLASLQPIQALAELEQNDEVSSSKSIEERAEIISKALQDRQQTVQKSDSSSSMFVAQWNNYRRSGDSNNQTIRGQGGA